VSSTAQAASPEVVVVVGLNFNPDDGDGALLVGRRKVTPYRTDDKETESGYRQKIAYQSNSLWVSIR
jgi:hypothetical protein